MKKMKFLLVFVVTLFMTGCVKMNATMKINKDKSMDYEIIMAVDDSLMQGSTSTVIDEKEMEEAKKNGFTIEDYTEDSMKGYKMTKHIKNIDSVSSKDSIESSIDAGSESEYLFTVKKGFFKNTYTAKLTSDSTDSLNDYMSDDDTSLDDTSDDDWSFDDEDETTLDDEDETILDDEDETTLDDEDETTLDDEDETTLDDETDYSKYMSNFDMKFEVNLPYKAKSNNASEVTNGGKKLTWNLMELNDDKAIEFEFAIYNITNIAIVGGIALALIILIIIIVFKNKKKKSNNIDQNSAINNQPKPVRVMEQPTVQPEPVQVNPYVQQNIVSEQNINNTVETNNEQTNNIQN